MPRNKERKKFVWGDDETDRLVDLWLDKAEAFRRHGKNTLIHKEMANSMKAYGPNSVEIKAKLDSMKKRYRKEVEKERSLNGTSWKYFPAMHEIFKHERKRIRPAIQNIECYSDEVTADSIHSNEDLEEEASTSDSSIEFFFPKPDLKRPKPDRCITMEEEKLAVQKDTLEVMRSIANEVSSFHTKFLSAYKQKHYKRSSRLN